VEGYFPSQILLEAENAGSGKLHLVLCLIVAGMIILSCQGVSAQANRASITGTVTDSSGAVVAGVEVTATNTGTNVPPKPSPMAMGFMSSQPLSGQYSVGIQEGRI